jgi:hypothetical protein
MTDQVGASSTRADTDGSRWSWLLPAGTFLAGCVLGGVLVGVGDVGDDEPSTPDGSAAAAVDADAGEEQDGTAAADASDGGDADSGMYVRVPESCVQTADDATALVEQVDRVVAAVADLEPERLRQTVDDVQVVRDEVSRVAEECRKAAAQRLQDVEDAEADDAADADPATPAS